MNQLKQTLMIILVSTSVLNSSGCGTQRTETATSTLPATVTPTVTPTPSPTPIAGNEMPLTMPVLDAFFFGDDRFADDLKSTLQLTDDQITRLRDAAREETAKLRESTDNDQGEYQGSTSAAAELANRRITEIMGDEKFRRLSDFVLLRWRGSNEGVTVSLGPSPTPSPTGSPITTPSPYPIGSPSATGTIVPSMAPAASSASHLVPSDTRVLINAPSYRMDVFENGQMIKSYKIGIGYPEFPVPTGLRQATSIIFNPTWTPPDEPWVESSGKFRIGEKVEAGSKLNPLGVIKIPIGLPSLIHGGKVPVKLGGFNSHGCVGLTNKQIQDFAKTLAYLGGVKLSDEEIAKREKSRAKTESVKLSNPVPVELRYETIVVENGKLHIYRDVYERRTNTVENLREVLAAYGVTMDQLSSEERARVEQALKEMSRGPSGTPVEETTVEEKERQKQRNIERGTLTRNIKGQKERVIEIAALAGKGQPTPVEINTGEVKKIEAQTSSVPHKKR